MFLCYQTNADDTRLQGFHWRVPLHILILYLYTMFYNLIFFKELEIFIPMKR